MILEIAPLALGIAASPFPVVPAILLLFTERPRATGGSFLAGWVIGVLLACGLATTLASIIELNEESPTWASWTRLGVGVLLLLLAIRQWRSRAEHAEPAWMQAMAGATPGSALRLGLLLSAANPKILLLAAAGGLAIGAADLTGSQAAISIVAFTAIASSTVALPWVLYLVRGDRMLTPLARVRDWLKTNNAVIMAVVLSVLGVMLIVKALSSL